MTFPELPWGTIAVTGLLIFQLATGGWPKYLDYYKLSLPLLAVNLIALPVLIGLSLLAWYPTNGEGILWWSWVKLLTGQSGGVFTAPLHIPVLGWVLMAALLLRLPEFAHYEEVAFRSRSKTLGQMVRTTALWAALHFLVGVPIAVCIAIGLTGGLVYNWLYQNFGLEAAARAHFQQNLIVISLLAITIFWSI